VLVRRLAEAPVEEWHKLRTNILMDAGELGDGRGSMTVAGDTQELSQGDLVMVPPATDHSISNEGGDSDLCCVSIQSPAVTVSEVYSPTPAGASDYDDEEY
jgi:glyoxylate utilization-related uncharacterized protein